MTSRMTVAVRMEPRVYSVESEIVDLAAPK